MRAEFITMYVVSAGYKIRSVRVVFPESMCADMPIFLNCCMSSSKEDVAAWANERTNDCFVRRDRRVNESIVEINVWWLIELLLVVG